MHGGATVGAKQSISVRYTVVVAHIVESLRCIPDVDRAIGAGVAARRVGGGGGGMTSATTIHSLNYYNYSSKKHLPSWQGTTVTFWLLFYIIIKVKGAKR